MDYSIKQTWLYLFWVYNVFFCTTVLSRVFENLDENFMVICEKQITCCKLRILLACSGSAFLMYASAIRNFKIAQSEKTTRNNRTLSWNRKRILCKAQLMKEFCFRGFDYCLSHEVLVHYILVNCISYNRINHLIWSLNTFPPSVCNKSPIHMNSIIAYALIHFPLHAS